MVLDIKKPFGAKTKLEKAQDQILIAYYELMLLVLLVVVLVLIRCRQLGLV